MACEQFIRLGNRITDSILLVLAFQGYYVFDAVLNEVGSYFFGAPVSFLIVI
jgi:hypothetical protein